MIDKEYIAYINEQPLSELKKIALRINKMHFPDEFQAVVNRIEELEGDNFDRNFYYNEEMKDALHLEVNQPENFEQRYRKSQKILSAFLFVFSIILSINVYNLFLEGNIISIIPVFTYLGLIILNIKQHKFFGKACKIWAASVVFITLILNFKDFLGVTNPSVLSFFNSLIGSNDLIQPTVILLAASVLIFIYADHINIEEDEN